MIRLTVVALAWVGVAGAQSRPVVEQQTSGTTARIQAVSAVNSRIAWASGTGGTFLKTIDGGRTWRAATVPGADSLEFRDVHGFDATRAVLLAAGPGDKSRLYHTSDGGATWALVFTNTDPQAFYDCFDFAGPIGVVVSDAVAGRLPLRRSEDGGRTWAAYYPPGYESVAAIEGEGAFAASGTCLAMRPDGGAWVGTAKGGRVIQFGPAGSAVYQTPIVRGAATAGIATLAFADAVVGIAAGGDLAKPNEFLDNVVLTSDGGKTWTLGGRPTFAGGVYGLAYVPGHGNTLVAVGPKGASWSADGGKTWQALDGNDYWGIGFAKGGTGWIAGPGGRIARVRW
jgi:photosystem II stability/assembly factor-like uncharacterized protein